jgi:nucleotide-binding universal stress UspA family protein
MFRVLVPVDEDDDRANQQVETVLSLPGETAELSATIVHIVEEIDTAADEAGTGVIEELNESLPELQGTPESINNVRSRLEAAGIDVTVASMVGNAAEGILHAAREGNIDAIVLGSRKRSPVGKAVFGSVSQQVILESDRPVIVAK